MELEGWLKARRWPNERDGVRSSKPFCQTRGELIELALFVRLCRKHMRDFSKQPLNIALQESSTKIYVMLIFIGFTIPDHVRLVSCFSSVAYCGGRLRYSTYSFEAVGESTISFRRWLFLFLLLRSTEGSIIRSSSTARCRSQGSGSKFRAFSYGRNSYRNQNSVCITIGYLLGS